MNGRILLLIFCFSAFFLCCSVSAQQYMTMEETTWNYTRKGDYITENGTRWSHNFHLIWIHNLTSEDYMKELNFSLTLTSLQYPQYYFDNRTFYTIIVGNETSLGSNTSIVYVYDCPEMPCGQYNLSLYRQASPWTLLQSEILTIFNPYEDPPTDIAMPFAFGAISIMSLSLIVGIGIAVLSAFKTQDFSILLPVVIITIGVTIALFIALPILNAFQGL